MKFKIQSAKFKVAAIIAVLMLAMVRPVAAQEATGGASQATASNAAESSPSAVATYQLPYAGLLPDNPLYFFKVLRDRISEMLIADSLKKAQFALLQADKRVSSTITLVEKGKIDLAVSTAGKGTNYLVLAHTHGQKAKGEGKDITAFSKKLRAALVKHQEVFVSLAGKTSGDAQVQFTNLLQTTTQIYNNLNY